MDILKIELLADRPVVKETLNRIGIINKIQKIIYPSCYLYSTETEDFLIHFKQLFMLKQANSYNNISELDIHRRNAIAFCLKNWGLINCNDNTIDPHHVKIEIIPFDQKFEWTVMHKIDLKLLN